MKCICLHNYVIKTKTPGVSTTRGGLILILLLRGGLELLVVEHMHSKLGYVCVLYNIIDKKTF